MTKRLDGMAGLLAAFALLAGGLALGAPAWLAAVAAAAVVALFVVRQRTGWDASEWWVGWVVVVLATVALLAFA